jgi:hypothetical protein
VHERPAFEVFAYQNQLKISIVNAHQHSGGSAVIHLNNSIGAGLWKYRRVKEFLNEINRRHYSPCGKALADVMPTARKTVHQFGYFCI